MATIKKVATKRGSNKKNKNSELTPKQILFAHEYIKHFNATKAALDAGYSEKTAAQIGHKLLNKPHIMQYVATLMEDRVKVAKVDAQWVLDKAVMVFDLAIEYGDLKSANSALVTIGKHVDVQAFEKELKVEITQHNIMLVPTAQNTDDWEAAAQVQQTKALDHKD